MGQITLKDDTVIRLAVTASGYPIRIADGCACDQHLWVYRDECGIRAIAIADSWESAYEAVIDELPTIEPSDVPEAYGFDTQAKLDAALQAAQDGSGEWPELVGGYRDQSNSSGTGIVSVSHSEALDPLDAELLRHLDIRLLVGRSDAPPICHVKLRNGYSDTATRGDVVTWIDGENDQRKIGRILGHERACSENGWNPHSDRLWVLEFMPQFGRAFSRIVDASDIDRVLDVDRALWFLTGEIDELEREDYQATASIGGRPVGGRGGEPPCANQEPYHHEH